MNLTAHATVLIDATATAATAVLIIAARGVLYPYFGLSSPLVLDIAAVAFIAYASIIALAARQPIISRATLMTIVAANIGYVVASTALLVMFWADMHAAGRALIIAVAVVVEVFATLQFTAARRLDNRLQLG